MTDRFPDQFPEKPPETIRADVDPRPSGAWRVWLGATALLILMLLLAAAVGWKTYFSDLPDLPEKPVLWSVNRAPGMTFLDRNGARIATRGPKHGVRVELSALPPHVPHAFLAAEDRRFYQHGAVDFIGIARSVRANLGAGEIVQGGSTLSQQLAKTIFLKPDQTLKRKLQEAVLATRLERMLGKDGVLELYLNRVYFGSNAFGIEAASQTYFAKPAAQLTVSEAALLAALPKAPSRLAPTRDLAGAVARSHLVLARMRGEGWITAQAEAQARAAPPRLAPPGQGEGAFGYALDLAAVQTMRLAGSQAPDLTVQMTIDPVLQTEAAEIVGRLMRSDGPGAGAQQAALIALGSQGAVRALVGGVDHRFSPFDRAAQARRQPGSAFKPFVFAAALEKGVRPTTVRQDKPVRLGPWSPQNYGGGFRGAVTVEEALVRSINTVAVRLAQETGPATVSTLARRFGVGGLPAKPGLSVALGTYEVSLMELTGAYQVFQQGGRRFPPYLVETIATSSGRELYRRHPSQALQVYEPAHARTMTRMMQGVIERGTGRRAGFGRPAAGKTGTSQNWRDAWFIGFTPDWTVGVWVGNDDSRPMNKVTGGALPAEIWRRFMIAAHRDIPAHPFGFDAASPSPSRAASAEPPPDAEPAQKAATAKPDAAEPDPPSAARAATTGAQRGFYSDMAQAFSDAPASAPQE